MRTPAAVAAAIGLFALTLAIPATAGEDSWPMQPYFYYCRSNAPVANAFYFSTTLPGNAGEARADLENSFVDFLRKKYKYPHDAAVSCVAAMGGDMQADTESSRLQTIGNLHAANYEVVVIDWKYAH